MKRLTGELPECHTCGKPLTRNEYVWAEIRPYAVIKRDGTVSRGETPTGRFWCGPCGKDDHADHD